MLSIYIKKKSFKFNPFSRSFPFVCPKQIIYYTVLLIKVLCLQYKSVCCSSYFFFVSLVSSFNMMFATIPSSVAPLKLDSVQK